MHDLHGINVSVHMIQLQKHWKDLDEVRYLRNVTWIYLKILLLSFLQIFCDTNMVDEQTCSVKSMLAPLAVGPYDDIWLQILEKHETSV
jgi:hypothetical protein